MPATIPGLDIVCAEVPGCAVAGFCEEFEIGRMSWNAAGVARKGARADVGLARVFVRDLELIRAKAFGGYVARAYIAAPARRWSGLSTPLVR